MISISSLFKQKIITPIVPLPERYAFLAQKEQNAFVKDIADYLEKNYPYFVPDFPQGVIYGANGQDLGLDNLIQMYHQTPIAKRQSVIHEHFSNLFKAENEESEFLKDIENFEKIKSLLAVRLYPSNMAPPMENMSICRSDIENTFTVMVFDLPSTIKVIHPDKAKPWKKRPSDLFEIGLKNTFAKYRVKVDEHQLEPGIFWYSFSGDHIFVSTHVFNLNKYPQVIGKFGSLVAIPHRDAILAFPINDLSIIKVINGFCVMADGMFREGPGSISSGVYWYSKKTFQNLPYKFDIVMKKLDFIPPENFLDMLNKLPE